MIPFYQRPPLYQSSIKLNVIRYLHTILLIGWLILTAWKLVLGYFISRDEGIVFIAYLYSYFVCIKF